jgi:hypothetical protein
MVLLVVVVVVVVVLALALAMLDDRLSSNRRDKRNVVDRNTLTRRIVNQYRHFFLLDSRLVAILGLLYNMK